MPTSTKIDTARPDCCPVCLQRGTPHLDIRNRVIVFLCKNQHTWRDVSERKETKNGKTKLGYT